MAVTKGAKKAHRASQKKKVYNDRNRKAIKEETKKVERLVLAKKKDEAKTELGKAYKAIDKAAKRGTIKKKTAGRKKARLAKLVNKA